MRRGPAVPIADGKTRITIRLDEDMVDWFRDQVTKVGAAKVYLGSEADGQNWLDSA